MKVPFEFAAKSMFTDKPRGKEFGISEYITYKEEHCGQQEYIVQLKAESMQPLIYKVGILIVE